MKETIFYLEGRGGMYIFHFFVYNLGGLYYILNKEYNIRYNDSCLFEDKSKITSFPSNNIQFPIKIHMSKILPFQREAFEIIKDKFQLVEDLSSIGEYEIVSIYGEVCYRTGTSDNKENVYPFLRNLFIEKCPFEMIKGKRIYITRKNSESQHYGTLKRCMLNENEFEPILNKYNIEYIQLENYNTFEKIKLFMESEIIISPNSSTLTLSLFSNKNSKIIEIVKNGTNGVRHYVEICNIIGLNYNKYENIIEDNNGNFHLNMIDFEKYLINIL